LLFRTTDVNRMVSRETFPYHRCGRCGLIFLGSMPSDLGRYYGNGYHARPRSAVDLERIAGRTRYQIDMVRRYVSGGRLLEIGPGMGVFAWLAKRYGFEVETIEQDADCCDYLRERIGVTVVRTGSPASVLAEWPRRYDAIVLWHVLEHLPDAWDVLDRAAGALKTQGILLVATPNPDAWQFRVMGRRWPHVDAPRHLYLIPAVVLRRQLEELGCECRLVTTTDPGGLRWNRFGWGRAAVNLLPPPTRNGLLARALAEAVGRGVSAFTGPFERVELRGSAYTAVFARTT
jgi:SAM-dependent methyltransferase